MGIATRVAAGGTVKREPLITEHSIRGPNHGEDRQVTEAGKRTF